MDFDYTILTVLINMYDIVFVTAFIGKSLYLRLFLIKISIILSIITLTE